MYRFVSATHVQLNSSLDMPVYLINEYICMRMTCKHQFAIKLEKQTVFLQFTKLQVILHTYIQVYSLIRYTDISRLLFSSMFVALTNRYISCPSLCHLSPGSSMVRASHWRSDGCGFDPRLGLRNIFLSLR